METARERILIKRYLELVDSSFCSEWMNAWAERVGVKQAAKCFITKFIHMYDVFFVSNDVNNCAHCELSTIHLLLVWMP